MNLNELPKNWIKKISNKFPDKFYYFNTKTGKSSWNIPSVPTDEQRHLKSNLKESSTVSNSDKLHFQQKSVPRKNIASDRLKLIQSQLADQQKNKTQNVVKNEKLPNQTNITLQTAKTELNSTSSQKNLQTPNVNIQNYKKRKLPDNQSELDYNQHNIKKAIIKHNNNIKEKFLPPTNIEHNFKIIKPNEISKLQQKINDKINVEARNISANERLQKFRKQLTENVNTKYDDDIIMADSWTRNTFNEELLEYMEWETIPIKDVIFEINNLREFENKNYENVDSIFFTTSTYLSSHKENIHYFNIIVDTNVFLSDLKFLYNVLKYEFSFINYPFLVVPYVVLQELDKIKSRTNSPVQIMAINSIRFLNEQLKEINQKVKGQNAIKANEFLIEIENPDDKILNCCLQIKNSTNYVILLSNDNNLRNKAMCNNIDAYSKDEFEKKKHEIMKRIKGYSTKKF